MPNLQIKGIDDALYSRIKEMAASENRSLSQQILFLTRQYLAEHHRGVSEKSPGQILLELAGSWDDPRSAKDIADEVRSQRESSTRFRMDF